MVKAVKGNIKDKAALRAALRFLGQDDTGTGGVDALLARALGDFDARAIPRTSAPAPAFAAARNDSSRR